MQDNSKTVSVISQNDTISLREIVWKYGRHWKLFFLSTAITLSIAFTYLRFATYEYQVASSILINVIENNSGSNADTSVFQDLGLFEGAKTSLDTELGVLKSITLIESVVDELKLNITYFNEDGIQKKEIYGDERPFIVNLFNNNIKLASLDTVFSISAKSDTKYDLFDSDDKFISEASFGESISCEFGDLVTTPLSVENIVLNEKIIVKILPIEDVSLDLQRRIEVAPENLNSNLVLLKLIDPIRLKAKDILNNLVAAYNRDAIEYKSQNAKITNQFVDSRISDISAELKSLDQGVQSYKTRNNLSNIDSEANLDLASNSQLGNRIVELTSQIKLIDYVTYYMKENEDELIPANLGLLNENTSQNSVNYNNLVMERNRLKKSANKDNPIISNLNSQIISLRESIDQSLINTKSSLEISLGEARLQESSLTLKLAANPRKEREIRDIQRQQEIYENLYLYLLQKKEENSISLAVTAPNAKIVDRAYGSRRPIAPRKIVVLLSSVLLGFLLPASVLTFKAIFNNKVDTLQDVKNVVDAPVLGELPNIKNNQEIDIFNSKNKNRAEPFRLIRANVGYFLKKFNTQKKIQKNRPLATSKEKVESGENTVNLVSDSSLKKVKLEFKDLTTDVIGRNTAKIIFVSSTIKKEGKTFVAINLATSLRLLNKKVLLVEADIRSPKIADYLKIKQNKGLVDFLINNKLKLTDAISYHKDTKLDVLQAGNIPENPGELLANVRFSELMEQSKAIYDYVVIDTCSLNVAADTLMICHHANLFIYVIRCHFLSKKMLHIPEAMSSNNRLPNMTILFNGTDYEKMGYDSAFNIEPEGNNRSWLKRLIG